jgi:Arc/MetJ-type ribon-helix-helix transcriptional regulator
MGPGLLVSLVSGIISSTPRNVMTRHLDPNDLPENVARYAQAQVAAGRFATIEDVLSAGIDALKEREAADEQWLDAARKEAAEGFAELDRGEGISMTATEHITRIDAVARARASERASK